MARRSDPRAAVKWAFLLEVGTVAWNLVEGVIATAAGVMAGSVALVGFGVDSFVETASGVVVGWRFLRQLRGMEGDAARRLERRTARIAGVLLLALGLYILLDSARRLLGLGPTPGKSTVGIVLTAVSLVVMPLLGWAKLRTARKLGSRSLRTDAYETITCAWLSLTILAGLVLNASLGWWWADPAAGLLLVPFIAREGIKSLRGEDED